MKQVRFPHLPSSRWGINKIFHSPESFLMSHMIDLKVVNNTEKNHERTPSWNALHENVCENKISFLQINIKHDLDRKWTRYNFVYFTWNACRRLCVWQLKPQRKHPVSNTANPCRRSYRGTVRSIGRKGSQSIVDKHLGSHNPRKWIFPTVYSLVPGTDVCWRLWSS